MASKKINNVYIADSFTIAGPFEKEGSVKDFDMTLEDFYFKKHTFEQAEIKMQKVVIDNLLAKNHLLPKDISLLVSGDLSNQIGASSYAASFYDFPYLGVYSACASFVESLFTAATFIESKTKANALCVTSSHNLAAEKQFRYPTEYGAPRPKTSTFTATGSVAVLLTKNETPVKLESYTVGTVVDMGQKDANNMGAIMAPAAAKVLADHLKEMKRSIDYYDLILTGDLGCVGSKILQEYLKQVYALKMPKHLDAGCELYLKSQEQTASGASGPVTLPLYLFGKILKSHKYHHILLIGTGSLHNPFLVNQKISIPAIAHAVSLEVSE